MGTGVTCNRSSQILHGWEEGTKGELLMIEDNLTLLSCLWTQVVIVMGHEQNLNVRNYLAFNSYTLCHCHLSLIICAGGR